MIAKLFKSYAVTDWLTEQPSNIIKFTKNHKEIYLTSILDTIRQIQENILPWECKWVKDKVVYWEALKLLSGLIINAQTLLTLLMFL